MIQVMTWTVVYRASPKTEQRELVRYTQEAANKFARGVIEDGGVAMVVEGSQEEASDDLNDNLPESTRSILKW